MGRVVEMRWVLISPWREEDDGVEIMSDGSSEATSLGE